MVRVGIGRDPFQHACYVVVRDLAKRVLGRVLRKVAQGGAGIIILFEAGDALLEGVRGGRRGTPGGNGGDAAEQENRSHSDRRHHRIAN